MVLSKILLFYSIFQSMHPNNIYGINSRLANVYYFDAWIKKCGPRNEFFVLQRIAEVYIGNEGG